MYNRYIPNGSAYTRIVEEESPRTAPIPPKPEAPPRSQRPPGHPPPPLLSLLSEFGGGKKNAGLAGIFEKLKLDDIDTGDILLILILLFLFRDGDDMETVLILGLLLLLGLGDHAENEV